MSTPLVSMPTVSVCVVTYNQVAYIGACLQSVVDQVCDFPIEIIVGDDGSTDGTTAIVQAFAKRHPERITAAIRAHNLGSAANHLATYAAARGRYIAHLDGDDCMAPGKLQHQVQALQQHPDCVLCTHDMAVIDRHGHPLRHSFQRHASGVFTLTELYQQLPFFAHSSVMFVNRPAMHTALHSARIDIEGYVAQLQQGPMVHLDLPLGLYREGVGLSQQAGGIHPELPAATRRIYQTALQGPPPPGLDRAGLRACYARALLNYAYQSALLGRRLDCRAYARESRRIHPLGLTPWLLLAASFLPRGLATLAHLRARWRYR